MIPSATPAGAAEPVTVMSALVINAIGVDTILPEFARTGRAARMVWDPTAALLKRIAAGERADVIFAIDYALDQLAEQGLIDATTRRPLVQATVGVAVRAGSPQPDISTAAHLRQTLLDVPTLVYSRAGASGIYFEKLIDRLGIGDDVRAKATVVPAGLTGEKAASGEVVLAIQQMSELLAVPGIDIVGPLPQEVQATTDFSAAAFTGTPHRDGALRFIEMLRTPTLRQAYVRIGLKPLFD